MSLSCSKQRTCDRDPGNHRESFASSSCSTQRLLPICRQTSVHLHLCRYGYKSIWEVEEVVANYSAAGLPLDTIWTDIDYMHAFRDFTFDDEKWPTERVQVGSRVWAERGTCVGLHVTHELAGAEHVCAVTSTSSVRWQLLCSIRLLQHSGCCLPGCAHETCHCQVC